MDEIYNMKLHSVIFPKDRQYNILRVHGGWIYCFTENPKNNVFVPDTSRGFQELLKEARKIEERGTND